MPNIHPLGGLFYPLRTMASPDDIGYQRGVHSDNPLIITYRYLRGIYHPLLVLNIRYGYRLVYHPGGTPTCLYLDPNRGQNA